MKKFLSLVLALVMTMSLVTVSAGAKDFTDSSKINYDEAVDVMSAVKVIDGYTDGSFNPSTTLTRGAAAKIICNLILGPTTASALVADAAPYKDVPTNHTFAGYIAYCQKTGIISGYADGSFKPANSLTGYAFMKMLLGALGYKAEQEGYTGANWSINVAKRALNIGLADDLVGYFNGVKAVNREEACLYAFNALQATMVEYEKNSTVTVGNITIKDTSDAKEMTCVKGSGNDGNIDKDGKVQFAEKYFTDLKLEEGSDDFGRPANTWKVKKDEVGTFANRGDLVATYTKKATKADIYSAVGKTVYDDLTDTKDPATLTVWFDGEKTVVKTADVDSYIEKNNSGKSNGTANGDLTEVYVDDDNNVTIVTIRTYVFQASADYDSKKEQVNLKTDSTKYDTNITLDDRTVSLDDYAVIKDLKEDDYVLVTAVVNKAGKYEIKSVEKAETKTAEVTGYKYQDSVTAGSDTYKYSATASGIKDTQYNVGKQATLVFDKYGYIIAIEESVVLSDYVFIEDFGSTSGLNKKAVANAVFPDGTDAEIVVKEAFDGTKQETVKSTIAGWTIASGNDHSGWYTYSKNSSDEYTLYAIESKYAPTNDKTYVYADGTVSVNSRVNPFEASIGAGDVTGVLANDDTVVVVNDTKGDYTVYTGVKNFPGITLTAAGSTAKVYTIHKTSGYASLIYIDVTGSATITGDKNSNLVYVISYDGKYVTTDNETYHKYTVLDGEEEVKVEADTPIQNKLGDVYQVANYLTKSKDRLTDFALVTSDDVGGVVIGGMNVKSNDTTTPSNSKPIAQSAGTLTIGGQKYLVAEDAKITLVTLNSAKIMNKDKDANYEVSANMTASGLIDALKGYDYTYNYGGKLTENKAAKGNTIKELYVTITAASEITAPSDDASITSIKFKGVEVNPTYVDGTTYNLKLTKTQNSAGGAKKAEITVAPGASIKVLWANNTTDVYAGNMATSTDDISGLNDTTPVVLTVICTAADGVHKTTVKINLTAASAVANAELKAADGAAKITVNNSTHVINIDSSVTLTSLTVVELKAALAVKAGTDGFQVMEPATGLVSGYVPKADTDSLTAHSVVVATQTEDGAQVVWTLTNG